MFSTWLGERTRELGCESAEDVRRLFERYGVRRSSSTIAYWLAGERVPERPVFLGILDALAVLTEAERLRVTALWLAATSPAAASV